MPLSFEHHISQKTIRFKKTKFCPLSMCNQYSFETNRPRPFCFLTVFVLPEFCLSWVLNHNKINSIFFITKCTCNMVSKISKIPIHNIRGRPLTIIQCEFSKQCSSYGQLNVGDQCRGRQILGKENKPCFISLYL